MSKKIKRIISVIILTLASLHIINAGNLNEELFDAVKNNNVEPVQLLLDKEVDVNAVDENGTTPLYWAAYKGHSEIAALLLDAGAYVNTTCNGMTSLHRAAFRGHSKVVELLLAVGANVDAVARDMKLELLYQVTYEGPKEETVKLLSDSSTNITNANDIDKIAPKHTPLHVAVLEGHEEVVRLLIEAGADVDAVTSDGRTPLLMATVANHKKVKQLLLDAGAKDEACCLCHIL